LSLGQLLASLGDLNERTDTLASAGLGGPHQYDVLHVRRQALGADQGQGDGAVLRVAWGNL